MFALIFAYLFAAALITACVVLLRSSAKQKRERSKPADMRRADDAERGDPFDQKKAYRAAQDASNWGSPGR